MYKIASNNRAEEEWCVVPLTMGKKDRFTMYTFFDFSCLVKYFSLWMITPFFLTMGMNREEQRAWITIPTTS